MAQNILVSSTPIYQVGRLATSADSGSGLANNSVSLLYLPVTGSNHVIGGLYWSYDADLLGALSGAIGSVIIQDGLPAIPLAGLTSYGITPVGLAALAAAFPTGYPGDATQSIVFQQDIIQGGPGAEQLFNGISGTASFGMLVTLIGVLGAAGKINARHWTQVSGQNVQNVNFSNPNFPQS